MEEFFKQIEGALAARLYYLALFGALSVPDICAALEDASGTTSGAKYKAWFDKHGPEYGATFDGRICYGYRCSMVHQGSAIPHGGSYDRVIFFEPGGSWNMHNCTWGMTGGPKILVMDVERLCNDIVAAGRAWFATVQTTPTVQTNLKTFVTRRTNGFPPFFVNVPPLIA